jgi:hypothetical protein
MLTRNKRQNFGMVCFVTELAQNLDAVEEG